MKPQTYRDLGLRRREFTYAWCNRTEIDFVCTRCLAIALDGKHCQYCRAMRELAKERARKFVEEQKTKLTHTCKEIS